MAAAPLSSASMPWPRALLRSEACACLYFQKKPHRPGWVSNR